MILREHKSRAFFFSSALVFRLWCRTENAQNKMIDSTIVPRIQERDTIKKKLPQKEGKNLSSIPRKKNMERESQAQKKKAVIIHWGQAIPDNFNATWSVTQQGRSNPYIN